MRGLDEMLQVTDYCPKGVGGVIVAVMHDEFRGMGFLACWNFWMGAVSGGCGLSAGSYARILDA